MVGISTRDFDPATVCKNHVLFLRWIIIQLCNQCQPYNPSRSYWNCWSIAPSISKRTVLPITNFQLCTIICYWYFNSSRIFNNFGSIICFRILHLFKLCTELVYNRTLLMHIFNKFCTHYNLYINDLKVLIKSFYMYLLAWYIN